MLNIARFDKLVKDLMGTTGRKEKESILSQYKDDDDVKEMLEYHFDIYKPSGISKKKLNKISTPEAFKNNPIDESYNILDLLKYLEVHRTGRIEDLNTVERYASALGPYAKLIYSLVCKDLRLGVQPITLNKIFGPGFIPTFDVMLAEKYYDAPDKYLPDGVDFILTTKLDGCVSPGCEVMTIDGPEIIRNLVDNKIKTKVLSYNEKENKFEYRDIIEWFKKPLDKPLVKLKLENGRSLKVTEDDYLLTSNRGWVQAKDLNLKDDLIDCLDYYNSLKLSCPDPRCKYKTNSEANLKNHLWHCKYTKNNYIREIEGFLDNSSLLEDYLNGESLFSLEDKLKISRPYLINYLKSHGAHIRNSKEQSNTKSTMGKTTSTNLIKWGGKTPSTNKEIKDKVKSTLISRYGVDNCSKIPGATQKAIDTKFKKYGTSNLVKCNLRSNLEILIEEFLNSKNIEYGIQFKVIKPLKDGHYDGMYRADFYIPTKNLIVEIFGDYWHANPHKYNPEDFIYRFEGKVPAKEVWAQDKIKEKIYKDKGFNYLVIWEEDIENENYKNILEVTYENL